MTNCKGESIMSKIPTAEEFMTEYNNMRMPRGVSYQKEIGEALIEFTKFHVEAALKAAAENATCYEYYEINGDVYLRVDRDSILDAYPLTNIK